MKRFRTPWCLLLGLALAPAAWAQSPDPEVTMDVVEDPEASGPVSNRIELPTPPQGAQAPGGPGGGSSEGEGSETGNEASRFGQETASEARNEARDRGRSFGQEVRERAQQLREERRSSSGVPDVELPSSASENAQENAQPGPPPLPEPAQGNPKGP